jgi:choline dehydrogenase-like flavoprotein
MALVIRRLSSPIEEIKDHHTVVVIGSGYGGSIAASRLARAKQQVCLLERGKELQPGEYPDTAPEVMRELLRSRETGLPLSDQLGRQWAVPSVALPSSMQTSACKPSHAYHAAGLLN